MPRPRVHDVESVLDVAEQLAGEGGPAAVTIRAVAARSGASSGSLYHSFASREALLGTMWLRAARRFLALQRDAVSEVLGAAAPDPVAAVVAAARTLSVLRARHPASTRLLTTQRRDALLDTGLLPDELAADLRDLDGEVVDLLRTLARAMWNRDDRAAVETIAICVVDLPTALLVNRRQRTIDVLDLLDAAVKAILARTPIGIR